MLEQHPSNSSDSSTAVESLAVFLHARAKAKMNKDEMRSIPPFEDWRESWVEEAKEILAFLGLSA